MSPRSIPPAQSGCFSAASSGTGANSAATIRASRRRKAPAGVSASGSPALSSAVMPCRASSAETRRARSRSGVMSAARAPGFSSASRSARAAATASACASGADSRVRPSAASFHFAGRRDCQAGSPAAGRSAMPIRSGRPGGTARSAASPCGQPCQRATSSRCAPIACRRRCWPQKGCVGASRIASHTASAEAWSTPCSTTAPCGSRVATTRSSSAAAGIVPPTPMPAAITGSAGGDSSQARVWTRSACTRRMPMSSSPSRPSQCCHCATTPRRKTRVICQCWACSSGTSEARRPSQVSASSSGALAASRARSRSSSAISSSRVASAPASDQACSGVAGPPRDAGSRRTKSASTAWRRSGSTAGGRSSSAGRASSSASSVDRPASARIRGSSRARGAVSAAFGTTARRKAMRSARAERRVGSRIVTRESRSGSAAMRNTPCARQSRNGRCAGMS